MIGNLVIFSCPGTNQEKGVVGMEEKESALKECPAYVPADTEKMEKTETDV